MIPRPATGPVDPYYREHYLKEGSDFRRLCVEAETLMNQITPEIRDTFQVWMKQIAAFDYLAFQVQSCAGRKGADVYQLYQVNMIRKHHAEALLAALQRIVGSPPGFVDGAGI